jgi:transposase
MIIPAHGLRIVLAVRPVDFRCGHDALTGLVQNALGLDPHSGLIVVFRSKRMDRLKILLWDGTGLVPIYKRLGDGGFTWPQVSDGVLRL